MDRHPRHPTRHHQGHPRGILTLAGWGADQAVSLVKREMPRKGLGAARAGTGRMRLEPTRPQEDVHALAAEGLDAPRNATRLASAEFTNGSTTTGIPITVISARTPRA
jgi:hypothetical protein